MRSRKIVLRHRVTSRTLISVKMPGKDPVLKEVWIDRGDTQKCGFVTVVASKNAGVWQDPGSCRSW
jgi:hypothetical protein